MGNKNTGECEISSYFKLLQILKNKWTGECEISEENYTCPFIFQDL